MENRDIIAISEYDRKRMFTSPNPNVKIGIDINEDGGDNMNDKYVTKEELQLQSQLLNSQVDNKISQLEGKIDSQAKVIDEKFNTLNAKIDGEFNALDEKLNSLSTKIDANNKITWWIMSLISAGIIIPAITLVVKIIISK